MYATGGTHLLCQLHTSIYFICCKNYNLKIDKSFNQSVLKFIKIVYFFK